MHGGPKAVVDAAIAVHADRVVVAAAPQPGVERGSGAFDGRVGLGPWVRYDVDVVFVVGDVVAGIGAGKAAQLHPRDVRGVRAGHRQVVGERAERSPVGGAAVHHVEHLQHAVRREGRVEGSHAVRGELGIEAMDQSLMGLAAEGEADGLFA